MRFEDIVTHKNHIDYLRNAVDREILPHALLLWGAPGTGKLSTALALSQYILCEDRSEGESCGKCRRCVKTRKFIHPDVLFVFPLTSVKDRCSERYPEWREVLLNDTYLDIAEWLQMVSSSSTAKNPQGNIYTAEVENIIHSLGMKSFEADAKVLIIWMAEFLRKEGNKLLKVIEEPPPDTFIILVAENRDAILPTIQSRCQQLYFPPLQESFIAGEAQLRLGISESRSASVAAGSRGSWKTAKMLLDNQASHPVHEIQDWIKACWQNDMSALLQWVNGISEKSRLEQQQFTEYLLTVWQKLFWLKWGVDFYSEAEEMKLLKWLNTRIEFVEFDDLRMLAERTLKEIQRNANSKILWMNTSLQFRDALVNKHARLRPAT